jgi:hypothetical protein
LVSPYVTLGPHSRRQKKVLWCGKFYSSIPHFGNLCYLLVCENAKKIFSHCNFYLLVCENAKTPFHTATFTSWCVKMQQTFSHYNFYSLGVEKKRSSPWNHARGTSGKGLPNKNPPTNKFIFFGWRNEQKFLQFITELWYLKHSQRFQPPTKCGVCFLLEVGSLLLRTKFCGRDCWYFLHLLQAVRKPKAHSFVCLFVCLIDWLIWIFIRNQQYFCSLEIYMFRNAQFLFGLFDSAATSS